MSIKPPAHKPQHSIQAPHPVLIMQDRHLHRTPRTTEVGRDLWRPSGSTPLPWQWQPWQGAQEHVKTAFEGLQGGETQLSVWKTLIVTHTAKKCFLDVQRESSVFQFVHITSCPGYRHRQELRSTFLTPSLQALQKKIILGSWVNYHILQGSFFFVHGHCLDFSNTLPYGKHQVSPLCLRSCTEQSTAKSLLNQIFLQFRPFWEEPLQPRINKNKQHLPR